MSQTCFRIPAGVVFERWHHQDEWVLYHSGTGETLRLAEAAVALLDMLSAGRELDRNALANGLNDLMDTPLEPDEMSPILEGLIQELLRHECIEAHPCT
jgi:PqqD family protein of HPr-rel-A system